MSLNVADLKDALYDAFTTMQDDADLAKKLSAAIADYAESGDITTTDSGQISAGTFAGSGSGKISVDSSVCENIIVAATDSMKSMVSGGDILFAAQIAAGIDAMMADGTVKTDVLGTATPPPPATPFPMGGKAEKKGGFVGVSATIQAAMAACFPAMMGMTEGGDDFFAAQLATAVTAYLKAGIITTNGTGALLGSTGSGVGIL